MALAKYKSRIQDSNSAFFDQSFHPGTACPSSGVYRCMNCGATVVGEKDRRLPPQNHHQHNPAQGSILWQCLVQTTHIHGGLRDA